ncbi:hypothetical protein HYX70_05160 [Candidatus Saccharibacteria bacterium]|nr:hypothetical protein [Candidatus Saccharibacteria bacterium]
MFTAIAAIMIFLLAALLLWFGWQLETGKRQPHPKDHFFPMFGRNVDYVLGVAGLLAGVGVLVVLAGLFVKNSPVVLIGTVLVVSGFGRAYMNPKAVGPTWARHKKHSHL